MRLWLTSVLQRLLESYHVYLCQYQRQNGRLPLLPDLLGHSRNEGAEFTPVSLTFDDGNSIQFRKFYPILAELDINATFYVVTSQIGKPGKMTWDELRELHARGNEVGSHTHTHPHLTTLPISELDLELKRSKSLLEPFGCTTLAYPFGEYNDRVVESAKRYYTAARSYHNLITRDRDVGYNHRLTREIYALKVFPTERPLPLQSHALLDLSTSVFRKTIRQLVERAIQENAWLIFVFHGTSDMSPRNVVDSVRKKFSETINRTRDPRRLKNDLIHYYGGVQANKFEWMCQYLINRSDVRTLPISRVIQRWDPSEAPEVER